MRIGSQFIRMVRLKLGNGLLIRIRTTTILFFSLIASVVMSQENQDSSETIQEQDKIALNTFTVGIGRASEIRSGAISSNLGIDYLYRIFPKWEVGVQLDTDWQKDFAKFEGVQVAGIAAFSITQKWPVFAGFGIAGEEEHIEGFFRVGTEYAFYMGKKQMFFISPGFFIDTTVNDVSPSIMIALGINW